MATSLSRRRFVQHSLTAGALAGLGDFAFLEGLAPVSADEARVFHSRVQFSPDIEPLVRLIEETERDRLLEAVAARMKQGVGYQQWLTAVFLAGVRGIRPRPVGFKFHAVLVINSAHLASLAMPDQERWLPLFWALDNFKSSQARNTEEGGWTMGPVEESKLPSAAQAKACFIQAMENWDEAAADAAITALVRTHGAGEILELLWRYGARDFRDIGHKAIYTANSWRLLQTIGWRHAEPVLRSLVFAMLEHEGTNPAKRDADADRPGRSNRQLLAQIRPDWFQGAAKPEATVDVLQCLRSGNGCDAVSAQMIQILNAGVSPASIWDGLFLRAGELIMQQPGIVGIHCVTSINALHHGYQVSSNDETRRLLMLQAGAFLALFHGAMKSRGKLRDDLHIDRLEKTAPKHSGAEAVDEVLHDVSGDRLTAARKTLALVESQNAVTEELMTAARRLIFSKGTDSHDYKFSSAALEDYYHATPAWRARYLATSMFNLRGLGDKNTSLLQRAQAALGKA